VPFEIAPERESGLCAPRKPTKNANAYIRRHYKGVLTSGYVPVLARYAWSRSFSLWALVEGVSACFGLVTPFNSCSRLKISAPFSSLRCRERRRHAPTHANNSCKNIGDALTSHLIFRSETLRTTLVCRQPVSPSVITGNSPSKVKSGGATAPKAELK
jgi:hypothetical protein